MALPQPDDEEQEQQVNPFLVLTPEMIDGINRMLFGIHHGEVTIKIIQGRFHALHRTDSYLIEQRKKRGK